MSQIPSTFGAPAGRPNDITSALSRVDTDQFLELMIAELQNQDPLDPADSSDFLQQITQIREIGASDRLSQVLDTVLAGQNLSTASSLIGKHVSALSDSGVEVKGVVDRVSVAVNDSLGQRDLRVHIGPNSFSLNKIRQINEPTSA